jgi:hypothetical protein
VTTDDRRFLGPAELRDVGAGREDALATGDHDGSRRLGGEQARRRGQLLEQRA